MSTALVTGGSRGLGKATAMELAQAGYDIAICYAGSASAADSTVEACKSNGVKAAAFKCDVADKSQVELLFAQIRDVLGPVDILVNNAGITADGLLLRMSEEDFDKVMAVNVKGAFLCSQAALKDMMRAKQGRIINISSVVGLAGNAGQANYAASKAGLIGLTKSIAKEYGGKGIRCNAIAPGFIKTDMTESLPINVREEYLKQIAARHFGRPEDVAALAAFLASEKAEYINGQVISVDGGM